MADSFDDIDIWDGVSTQEWNQSLSQIQRVEQSHDIKRSLKRPAENDESDASSSKRTKSFSDGSWPSAEASGSSSGLNGTEPEDDETGLPPEAPATVTIKGVEDSTDSEAEEDQEADVEFDDDEDGPPPQRPPRPPSSSLPASFSLRDGHLHMFDNPSLLSLMNRCNLAYGVQYEVCRYYGKGPRLQFTIEEYRSAFQSLKGSNAMSAPRVLEELRKLQEARDGGSGARKQRVGDTPISKEAAEIIRRINEAAGEDRGAGDPWEQLDKEEAAIVSGDGSMLGVFGGPNGWWYGGRVHFGLTLVQDTNNQSSFKFHLDPPCLGKSTRFSRQFGSRRFMTVTLPKKGKMSISPLKEFLKNKFVFLGRVFQAVYVREGSCYLLETDDYNFGSSSVRPSPLSRSGRMTLSEFANWHNPLEFNQSQTLAKYLNRFALGLSVSVPAFRVPLQNMHFIEDIISPSFTGPGKPPAHQIMTDGAGYMNDAAAVRVKELLRLNYKPVAIQGRIGGAKGMFVLHPTDAEQSAEPEIWCRSSQVKIKYNAAGTASPDPAHCVFDLLRTSHLSMPAKLSKQTILCLTHGGVPRQVFSTLFREQLQSQFQVFSQLPELAQLPASADTTHKINSALLKIFEFVSKGESVPQARLKRQLAGLARVLGLGEDANEGGYREGSFDAADATTEQSTPWAPDPISGLPSSLAETIMAFLASGFRPWENAYLFGKLKKALEALLKTYINRYKIALPMSAVGFAIPDPCGVLEEGEIFCRSSIPWTDSSGIPTDTVLGDVLATRHPCVVSSDVRKFRAVDRPELRQYTNVVIFSTKGFRSAMSWLSGGDFDGDTVNLIWDLLFVNAFMNAPVCRGDLPDGFLAQNFERHTHSAADFFASLSTCANQEAELRSLFVEALADMSAVGRYSVFHEKAAYQLGYDHPDAVRLALMFCTTLDASKSGLRVLSAVFNNDVETWDHLRLLGQGEQLRRKAGTRRDVELKRSPELPPDVIDVLYKLGTKLKEEQLERLGKGPADRKDAALSKPYETLCADILIVAQSSRADLAKWQREDLNLIKATVDPLFDSFARGKDEALEQARKLSGRLIGSFTNMDIVDRQDFLRAQSAEYAAKIEALVPLCSSLRGSGTTTSLHEIAASYLHVASFRNGPFQSETRLSYDLAFRELATIKARASGTMVPTLHVFNKHFVLHRPSLNLM